DGSAEEQFAWLQYLAGYANEQHNANEFAEQLLRLLPIAPTQVSEAFRQLISKNTPTYDYEDRMKSLIRGLAAAGCRADAIEYATRFVELPGMYDLYNELCTKNA